MKRIWDFLKGIWLPKDNEPKDETIYLARCGHETKLVDEIEIYGQSVRIKIGLQDGQPDYCLDCLSKMAIRCAWCGGVIVPGDTITLYSLSPIALDKTMPDYAVAYQDGLDQCFVGCLGWNCAETGADRAGCWVPPGEVKRVASPLELAMASGAAVVVGDLSSQEEEPIIQHLKIEG